MNLEVKDIPKKFAPLLQNLKRYAKLIFVLTLLILYVFLVYKIRTYTSEEPSEDAVTESLQSVQRPRIDQESIDKIQQLEEQNVQVHSLFQESRDNPFNE